MNSISKAKLRKQILRIVVSVLLWVFAAIWFIPIFWMFITSLKESTLATSEYPPQWIPSSPTLENYRRVLMPASGISVARGIKNSLIISVLSTVLGFVVATPAAYALSRLKFRGQRVIFWLYIAVLAFPGIIWRCQLKPGNTIK
ncbi:carbohydrate ABC transporter permease [Pseudothermotoga thermarum]|uniref:carbohydrate ABC transporter permease n=1 Tax=Pseudothermotoga thermarum TaxID=119394 RepID=UPI00030558DD|nr:carbohydrate ABC transporter permease [Pseudothermotoga thermarum]